MSVEVTYRANIDYWDFATILINAVPTGKFKLVTDTRKEDQLRYDIEVEYDGHCTEYTTKRFLGFLWKYESENVVNCPKTVWVEEQNVDFFEEKIFECTDYETVTDE